MIETTEKTFSFGDFVIDTERGLLLKRGEAVALNRKAFDLLLVLARNRGRILSKDELLEKVWTGQFVEENNLTVHISALRKIFGEKKSENRFIATVSGKGYKFVAELDEATDEREVTIENHSFSRIVVEEFLEPETDDFSAPPKQIAAPEKARNNFKSRLKQNLPAIAASILLLTILGFGGYFWQREQSAQNSAPFQQISIKRLTSGGEALNAALAPDGKLFVYSAGLPRRSLWFGHTADGRTVVFGSNRSGAFEVWRVNTDGGDLRQLTFGGYNEQPSVSPDGKYAVYVSMRDGLDNLWRAPLEGGEPVKLSDRQTSWARVSPDSRFVACGYGDSGGGGKTILAVLPIDGGAPVKLFDLPASANLRYALRWTPDGKFLTYRDWENGLWRQPLDGGSPQRVEDLPEEKLFAYDWSPDGTQIAFTRGVDVRDVVLLQTINK